MTGKSAREALSVSNNRLMVNSEFFRIEVLNVRNYVTVKVLVPVDVAVGVVIEDGISQCNQERKLLDENYYVTNVKIPTEAELQAFLKLT